MAFQAEVAFRAAVALALMSSGCIARVEVQLFLCVSTLHTESLRCHFCKEGSCPFDLTKHHRLSFYCSLHHFMPRKHNIPLLLFSQFGARYLNQILHSLYCGSPKPTYGHFCHIQRQAHIGLFQLYTTSLPCHSSRHVENLEDICCCL